MISLKNINPDNWERFDVRAIEKQIAANIKEVERSTRESLEKTVQTWNNKPSWNVEKTREGFKMGTSDPVYNYVNSGTRPHSIRPQGARAMQFKTGYTSKTTPNSGQSSSGGGSGDTRYSKAVMHPGTAARNFYDIVQQSMLGYVEAIDWFAVI